MGFIVCWIFEFFGDLIVSRLDLLHEKDIRIMGLEETSELSFVRSSTDAVHVPGDDTHREKIYTISV